MRPLRWLLAAAVLLALAAVALISKEKSPFDVLPSTARMGHQKDDSFLVSTNQQVRRLRNEWPLRGRPIEAAFDPQKRWLAVLNNRAIDLIDPATGAEVAAIASRPTSYTGLAFRPGGRELWSSEATRAAVDSILITPLDESGKPGKSERISLPNHPVPVGIAFSPGGESAFVALSNRNTVAVIDTKTRTIAREIPTGAVPYALAVSAKRNVLVVSNRGGRLPSAGDTTAVSSASTVVTDPSTGATTSGTLTVVDLKTNSAREINVGLAPAALAISPDENTLAVANAHSDSVTLVDLEKWTTAETKVPCYPVGTFGATPGSLAFSPDGATLYVASGGTNSIAVLKRAKSAWSYRGAVPAGWFPSAVAVDQAGNLLVVNVKGVGSTLRPEGNYNSRAYEGSLQRIPAPSDSTLKAGVREVTAANAPRFTPAGGVNDLAKLGIRHVFLIIKENRTYDQVFGDLSKGNNDPKLTMYGRAVTPNHHALAEEFVIFDNFYTGGAISFDGHQWLLQGFVNDYVERSLNTAARGYAWNLADALVVSPSGFFWQDANRPITLRLFGPASEHIKWAPNGQAVDINETDLLPWNEYWRIHKEGKWRGVVGHRSGVPALQKYIEARYPSSSMFIPDQLRADVFGEVLGEMEKSGTMPELMVFTMTSDHTMGTRAGFPVPRAMVADNDLALGRMVEAISKSRFWPESLILVTEDDAQDGVDHVDGRRTIALAIGPHVRRGGVVDGNHYTHSSLIRTVQDIFRIRPRVRYTATARAMNSAFTTAADTRPYTMRAPEVPLDEMNPVKTAGMPARRAWAAAQSARIDPNEVDEFPAATLNRILWWDAKGYDTPYPSR